ncbi:hypothetical protein WOLCODRAFT_24115 [Wolfiporia cocos MD-104 SS10]|uniref:Mid2 domain-containing protein n=1 Tax=Wolfiporia cocos (strain MD-104) TaxID=742152 RepID=A0A2H3JWC6_WOLCO|nr:hypothetical protein WOLCODRAFT_24115 [Wolfiporia cocos MD-104 SS10]
MTEVLGESYVVYDDWSSAVHYSGPWIHYSSLSGNWAVWNSTLSDGSSSSCSFTFNFSATAVAVVGTILPANSSSILPSSSYSIDGSSASTYTPPSNTTARTDNEIFYVSAALSDGQHTLTMTVNNATAQNPVLIDYILVASVSTGSGAGASPTYMTTSLPTGTGLAAEEDVAHSGPEVGAIVGGVVGGVAILVAAALALWFLWTRRRRSGPYYYRSAEDMDTDLRPFLATPHSNPTSAAYEPDVFTRQSVGSIDSAAGPSTRRRATMDSMSETSYLAGGSAGQGEGLSTSAAADGRPLSKAELIGIRSVAPATTYHTDAGVRFDATGAVQASSSDHATLIPTDMPPEYSER